MHELDRARSGPLPPGALFFTADHLAGPPARAHVAAQPEAERSAVLVGLGADLAAALAELHGAGLTHHDVKTDNVLVDAGGRAVPADLGLSRARGGDGVGRGTPAYMAPEALVGSHEPAIDLFGLGATLYELAAGRPPYLGEGGAVIRAALACQAPALP